MGEGFRIGAVLWIVITVLGALLLIGLAVLWAKVLRWAFRMNELVEIQKDALRELRELGRLLGRGPVPAEVTLGHTEAQPRTCPRCRLANAPGATHCEKCGALL